MIIHLWFVSYPQFLLTTYFFSGIVNAECIRHTKIEKRKVPQRRKAIEVFFCQSPRREPC